MEILSLLKQSISADGSYVWILLLSFLTGILISFSPCIYPMIPITVGIMQTQTSKSLWHGFLTGFYYVLGLATIYAILGLVSATTGIIFGQWITSPFFIFFIVILFLYLAFSLFGFYEIYIPSFLAHSTDVKGIQSPFFKSFVLGLLTGTFASPCLTPALAMLLTLVAEKGNIILGFFAMFLFAFGMGFLLIFIGMFSASLQFLPRAGEWMNEVRRFLGFVMLAMCVYFLRSLLNVQLQYLFYVIICVSMSIYYFYMAQINQIFKLLLGLFFAGLTIFLLLNIF